MRNNKSGLGVLCISMLILASCNKSNTPSYVQELKEMKDAKNPVIQLEKFKNVSSMTTSRVISALSSEGGIKSQEFKDLPQSLISGLSSIYDQTVESYPKLAGRPAWLADSFQVVQDNNLTGVEPKLYGLYTIAVDLSGDQPTIWSNKILIDLESMEIIDNVINSDFNTSFLSIENKALQTGLAIDSFRAELQGSEFKINKIDQYAAMITSSSTDIRPAVIYPDNF